MASAPSSPSRNEEQAISTPSWEERQASQAAQRLEGWKEENKQNKRIVTIETGKSDTETGKSDIETAGRLDTELSSRAGTNCVEMDAQTTPGAEGLDAQSTSIPEAQVDTAETKTDEAPAPEILDVLEFVEGMFQTADTDGSGFLDADELFEVVDAYYKKERLAPMAPGSKRLPPRRERAVRSEVKRALVEFDADGSGELDFNEFVTMMCTSQEFKFKLTTEQKAELLKANNNKAS